MAELKARRLDMCSSTRYDFLNYSQCTYVPIQGLQRSSQRWDRLLAFRVTRLTVMSDGFLECPSVRVDSHIPRDLLCQRKLSLGK